MEPVIWKFPLEKTFNMQLVELPKPGRIIAADHEHIWAEVDPDPEAQKIKRIVQICFTGDQAPLDARHINTHRCENQLVWHIYEVNP